MTEQNHQNLYQTKDSESAVILYSMKVVLNSTFWDKGSCYFVFQNRNLCEKVLSDYLNDKIVISAKLLMDSYKTIKSVIRGSN